MILNIKLIIKIYGFIGLFIGLAMLPSIITAFVYSETGIAKTFIVTCLAVIIVSLICILGVKPKKTHLKTRDGFFIVGFGWLLVIFIGCIPYLASGYTDSFCSAFSSRRQDLRLRAPLFLLPMRHLKLFSCGKPFHTGSAVWE